MTRLYNEVLIWNEEENRVATPQEIDGLIDDGDLFINYYIVGDKKGEVFVDLRNYDYLIKYKYTR